MERQRNLRIPANTFNPQVSFYFHLRLLLPLSTQKSKAGSTGSNRLYSPFNNKQEKNYFRFVRVFIKKIINVPLISNTSSKSRECSGMYPQTLSPTKSGDKALRCPRCSENFPKISRLPKDRRLTCRCFARRHYLQTRKGYYYGY